VLGVIVCCTAQAAIDQHLLLDLAGDDPDARIVAVNAIAALANDEAVQVLNALKGENLYLKDNVFYQVDGENITNLISGKASSLPDGADALVINNRLRGALENALSGMKLFQKTRQHVSLRCTIYSR